MLTLNRYLGISIGRGYLLVMLVLLSLFTVVNFVDQLEDVGKGDYQISDALMFVILMMPRHMLDLVPATALLGSFIALGSLANNSELIAMRAAGVSVLQICVSVMSTGVLLMLAVAIVEEFIAPPLQQFAQKQQSLALAGRKSSGTSGFWSRDGLRFINIRNIRHGRIPADIDIYEFDEQGQLRTFIYADTADISRRHHWLLRKVAYKALEGKNITTRHLPSLPWQSFLTAEQLQVLEPSSGSLAPSDLHHYIRYLKRTGQRADRYQLKLWQKLSLPLLTGAMVMLSIPFVFGMPRVNTLGQRIMLGTLVGIGVYFLGQIIANVGLLLSLSAPLIAMTPVVIILGIAALLLHRISKAV